MRKTLCVVFLTVAWACFASLGMAAYPDKPLRMIVPYGPGATADIVGRLMAKYLEQGIGKAIVVDNKPGAGGSMGAADLIKSPADGYTLLVVTTGHPTLQFYYKLSFDPILDNQPLSLVLNSPLVLVMNPLLPIKSVGDLIAYAKVNPGKLNFATTGSGEPLLIFEMFKKEGRVDMVHVPYKSGTDALNGVLRGDSHMQFTNVFQAKQFEQEGRLRIVAVSTRLRSKALPGISTLVESGFPNAIGNNYAGLVVRKGIPREIVARLYQEVISMTRNAEFIAAADKLGFESVGSTPEEFMDIMETQLKTWTPYAQGLGIKPE